MLQRSGWYAAATVLALASAAPATADEASEEACNLGRAAVLDATLADADFLIAQADRKLTEDRKDRQELAYRYLTLVFLMDPESPRSAEAFARAARLYRTLYMNYRVWQPRSIYASSERLFMFQWLRSFYEEGHFPQEQADQLFKGLPLSFAESYVPFAELRPLLSDWSMEFLEDNGLVEVVKATPVARTAQNP